MISAFSNAYQVLDDPRYLEAGKRAVQFIRVSFFQHYLVLHLMQICLNGFLLAIFVDTRRMFDS
jgi:uncharacterized protein YyaL (SSP411 family)